MRRRGSKDSERDWSSLHRSLTDIHLHRRNFHQARKNTPWLREMLACCAWLIAARIDYAWMGAAHRSLTDTLVGVSINHHIRQGRCLLYLSRRASRHTQFLLSESPGNPGNNKFGSFFRLSRKSLEITNSAMPCLKMFFGLRRLQLYKTIDGLSNFIIQCALRIVGRLQMNNQIWDRHIKLII